MIASVDAARFKAPEFGKATKRPGDRWAFTYFLPEKISRHLPLAPETVLALSDADNALGNLQGLGRLIPEPDLLVGPFLTREAVASSRIEGTNASLSDVLKAEEAVAERSDDVMEVERYLAAIRHGLKFIEELPITQRLIKDLHRILMTGVRGEERQPGEIRSTPVWIGSRTATPETAVFVPPLPEDLPDLITDWETYVNEPPREPVLVRCAIMHYQFETVHPFLDGNGRIGRLLVVLLLIAERRLMAPLLYLSGYLESNRREYYERLQAVRERGEIQEWIQFFCTAVARQSEDASWRANRLVELREKYLRQSATDRSRVASIIPLVFQNPFITARRVERAVGITNQGARNLLEKAVDYGWITHIGSSGRGGRHYWAAEDILETIETSTIYPQETDDSTHY
jgi:Fic family protein